MYFLNQGFQTLGERIGAHHPVAQPGMLASPRAEPAIVNAEELNPDRGCFARQRGLALVAEIEVSGFPTVIQHRAEAWALRRSGQYPVLCESVQPATGPAPPIWADAAHEGRCDVRFTRREVQLKIEGMIPGVNADVPGRQLLDSDLPTAAVGQRPEIHCAGLFPRLARAVHEEDRVGDMPGLQVAALNEMRARRQPFTLRREFPRPTAADVRQFVRAAGQVQRRKVADLERNGVLSRVV